MNIMWPHHPKGPYRPKGPQRPMNPFKRRRTNWEGAGGPSQYERFWPTKENVGTKIEFYDGSLYIVTDKGMVRIEKESSNESI